MIDVVGYIVCSKYVFDVGSCGVIFNVVINFNIFVCYIELFFENIGVGCMVYGNKYIL